MLNVYSQRSQEGFMECGQDGNAVNVNEKGLTGLIETIRDLHP